MVKKKKKKKTTCQCRRHKRCGLGSWGWEDPLEKGTAIHSSILENPVDRGAWWATVHRVAKESDTTAHMQA